MPLPRGLAMSKFSNDDHFGLRRVGDWRRHSRQHGPIAGFGPSPNPVITPSWLTTERRSSPEGRLQNRPQDAILPHGRYTEVPPCESLCSRRWLPLPRELWFRALSRLNPANCFLSLRRSYYWVLSATGVGRVYSRSVARCSLCSQPAPYTRPPPERLPLLLIR